MINIRAYIREIRASIAKRGMILTIKLAYSQLSKRNVQYLMDDFDKKYNVETSGIVRAGNLKTDSKNWKFASAYKALPSSFSISEVLSNFEIDISEYTFIDLGSGKGRALMMASMLPFKKILGIEFSEDLNNIAKSNLDKFPERVQLCSNISLLQIDASEYKFSEKKFVLLIFNPFHQPIMKKVLDNIKAQLNKKLEKFIIIYYHPQFAHLFNELDYLTLRKEISCSDYYVYEVKLNSEICYLS